MSTNQSNWRGVDKTQKFCIFLSCTRKFLTTVKENEKVQTSKTLTMNEWSYDIGKWYFFTNNAKFASWSKRNKAVLILQFKCCFSGSQSDSISTNCTNAAELSVLLVYDQNVICTVGLSLILTCRNLKSLSFIACNMASLLRSPIL